MKEKIIKLITTIKNLPRNKTWRLISIFLIIAAIALTVFVAQKQQETRQRAAEVTPSLFGKDKKHKIKYDQTAVKKSYERFTKRNSPTNPDIKTKEAFLTKLGNHSTAIVISDNVEFNYISGPNSFEATILTENIDLAKKEMEDFLIAQGFTNQNICDLPLRYFLSPQVIDALPDGTVFNPNPLTCP